MPYYSDELIEQVRSANDIVNVISDYVRLQKKGSTHFGLCPFHNEKTPRQPGQADVLLFWLRGRWECYHIFNAV